jgi:hypothetical protein
VSRLPKLPAPPPRRPAPAPSRGPAIEVHAWREEEPTARKNETLALYQSLLSVFDGMDPEARTEFVEFAAVWRGLKREDRAAVLRLLAEYRP